MADAAGIDVSNYQGTFNWQAQKGHIAFAFMKATEGATYTDPDFARNWQQSKSIGIVRGAYHFGHPRNGAATDARAFLAVVRANGLQHGDLIALDLEVSDGLGPAGVATYARNWCADVATATGITPVVYTFLSFAEQGNCAGLGGHPLWIADPSSPAGRPRVPPPWTRWTFHQYSSSPLDKDVFNGDTAALKAFANPAPPPPPVQEEEVQSGTLSNGAGALTVISIPKGSARAIGFGCDNDLQGLPPAQLRVAVWYGTRWEVHDPVTVDGGKGQTVLTFDKPATTSVVSVKRTDAGNVIVGYEVS